MLRGHFIKFIDATAALIGEDESSGLQSEVISGFFGQSHGEAGRGRRVSGDEHSARSHTCARSQHLRFTEAGVADDQYTVKIRLNEIRLNNRFT